MIIDSGIATGSFTVSGSLNVLGNTNINGNTTITGSVNVLGGISGSFSGLIDNALTASYINGLDQQVVIGYVAETTSSATLQVYSSQSFAIGRFYGDFNDTTNVVVKNLNAGVSASSNVTVVANNGTSRSEYYADFGINSSGHGDSFVGTANDAYLVNAGKNLYVGTLSAGLGNPTNVYIFGQDNWQNPQIAVLSTDQIGFNTTTITAGYTYEFSGSAKFNQDVLINGTLTANTVHTIYETASVIYSSGSNVFGDASNDIQTLYGTVDIKTGPVTVTGSVNASNGFIGDLTGNASTATSAINAQTASYVDIAQTASYVTIAQTASYVLNAVTASYVLSAVTASYVLDAVSASHATQADTAISAPYYVLTASYNADSASFSTRITNQESFSSSLDATFATDAQLNAATASLQAGVTASINDLSSSVAPQIADLQSWSSSLDNTYATDAQLNTATASLQAGVTASINTATASLQAGVTASINDLSSSIAPQIANLETTSSLLVSASGSFSTRVTDLESFSSSLDTVFATDAQLNAATASLQAGVTASINDLSSSIVPRIIGLEITSSTLLSASASFSTRVTDLESFSSSLDTIYATDVQVTASINTLSSSLAIPIANLEITASNLVVASGSLSTRTTNLESTASSLVAASASFSTRVTNNESTGSNLVAASASFSTRVTNNELTGSNLVAASASFSTRVTNNELTGSSLTTASASFVANYVKNSQTSSMTVLSASFAATASSADQFNVRTALTASGLRYPTVDDGALSFMQSDGAGNLSLQYVNTMNQTVYNGEAFTLPKGSPVYISGSQGANPIAYLADAANPAKMPVTFIIGDTINSGNTGRAIILGDINGIDLTGYTAGTEVYAAPGGGWTSTRPTGSAIVQVLGYVTKGGNGGKGVVLNPGPANLPNIQSGYTWIGDTNSYPIAIATSSIQNVVSSSYSSYASNAGLFAGRDTLSFASTASNTFTGSQYISDITNATGFTSNAAVYTDGGLRVSKDAYVSGSMYVAGDFTVYGTASVTYVTTSVFVGLEYIDLNTDLPAIRYAGMRVSDSGSVATYVTSSLLWDSENNNWIYSNPSGSTYSGGMLISGPRAAAIGEEQGTLNNVITKGQGGDHITSSQIVDDGTTVRMPGNLQVTGSLFAGNLTGSLNGSNLVAGSVTNDKLTNSSVTVTAGTGLIGGGTVALGSSITLTNSGVTSFNTRTNAVTLAATDISGLGAGIFSGSTQIPNGSITNAQLANSTISGIALGSNLATLTIGTGLSGTSYNGSGAVTIANTGVTSFNTRTGAVTLAATDISGLGAGIFSGSAQIPNTSITNAQLANSSVTVNGSAISLGGSATITAVNPNALTIGTGLSGTSYSGAAAVTIANTGVLSLTTNTGLSTNASATGNVTITNTGVTSNVAGAGISVSGATGAVTITNTGVTSVAQGTGVSVSAGTGAVTISIGQSVATTATPSFDQVLSTNNGNGTNFKVGDDAWIGDVNAANTIRIKGQQDATAGYITFGNNATALGSTNSSTLTWGASFTATGDVTAYSDARVKENVETITSALDKVLRLRGVTYTRTDLEDKSKKIGFIAQEIQEVVPEVVTDENDRLSVAYGNLGGLFVEAIKEQDKVIKDQQKQIDELKTLVNQLLNK